MAALYTAEVNPFRQKVWPRGGGGGDQDPSPFQIEGWSEVVTHWAMDSSRCNCIWYKFNTMHGKLERNLKLAWLAPAVQWRCLDYKNIYHIRKKRAFRNGGKLTIGPSCIGLGGRLMSLSGGGLLSLSTSVGMSSPPESHTQSSLLTVPSRGKMDSILSCRQVWRLPSSI